MKYIELDAEIIFQQNGSVGKRLARFNECEFVKLIIKPGGTIEPHSLDMPVTFYVISGTGTLELDDKVLETVKGDLLSAAPGQERMWKNICQENLIVLVIKHIGTKP